jgi:hypothetical protein
MFFVLLFLFPSFCFAGGVETSEVSLIPLVVILLCFLAAVGLLFFVKTSAVASSAAAPVGSLSQGATHVGNAVNSARDMGFHTVAHNLEAVQTALQTAENVVTSVFQLIGVGSTLKERLVESALPYVLNTLRNDISSFLTRQTRSAVLAIVICCTLVPVRSYSPFVSACGAIAISSFSVILAFQSLTGIAAVFRLSLLNFLKSLFAFEFLMKILPAPSSTVAQLKRNASVEAGKLIRQAIISQTVALSFSMWLLAQLSLLILQIFWPFLRPIASGMLIYQSGYSNMPVVFGSVGVIAVIAAALVIQDRMAQRRFAAGAPPALPTPLSDVDDGPPSSEAPPLAPAPPPPPAPLAPPVISSSKPNLVHRPPSQPQPRKPVEEDPQTNLLRELQARISNRRGKMDPETSSSTFD